MLSCQNKNSNLIFSFRGRDSSQDWAKATRIWQFLLFSRDISPMTGSIDIICPVKAASFLAEQLSSWMSSDKKAFSFSNRFCLTEKTPFAESQEKPTHSKHWTGSQTDFLTFHTIPALLRSWRTWMLSESAFALLGAELKPSSRYKQIFILDRLQWLTRGLRILVKMNTYRGPNFFL